MKLRNKKTGEIRNVEIMGDNFLIEAKDYPNDTTIVIKSLAELNEEWEDYEEPKDHWFIDYDGGIVSFKIRKETATDMLMKAIGNYFETQEKAEKAVEKLRAWKRLRDKGFHFECVEEYENLCGNGFEIPIRAIMSPENYTDIKVANDLELLFGGEE